MSGEAKRGNSPSPRHFNASRRRLPCSTSLRQLSLSFSPRTPSPLQQATNDLARRLSFSIALSLASLLSSVGVFVDAPAAALVDLAQRRPARLRSLLIA